MSARKRLDPEVPHQDLWVMLLSTIRYSMGRQTYMPSMCRELVARYRTHLTPEQLIHIRREVADELRRAKWSGVPIGAECDQREWQGIVQDLEAV